MRRPRVARSFTECRIRKVLWFFPPLAPRFATIGPRSWKKYRIFMEGSAMTITDERIGTRTDRHPDLVAWVDSIARLTRPDDIHWCDGSLAERDALLTAAVETGTLTRLNPEHRPYSFLARSTVDDVARTEQRTFVCSERETDAGPTKNWMAPAEMRALLEQRFDGAMRGRTMYVVPFSMGPVDSPFARFGVQLTDSPYVVLSTGTMTRMGDA